MKNHYTIHDFDYQLPKHLIAKYPLINRSASRLLMLDRMRQQPAHRQFNDILTVLAAGDLIVFNNTKVIPARLFGCKLTGGKIECLIERILAPQQALAYVRSNKALKIGSEFKLVDETRVRIIGREASLFRLEFITTMPLLTILQQHGEIPLPPYLERSPEILDNDRYQTIFAERAGAVAAPTAGLHFDAALLTAIQAKGVEVGKVTLHVGAGTFQPVRVEQLDQHVMHKEYIEVSAALCDQVEACKARGGRVFAVGTTVVRCLETAASQGSIQPYQGDTQLFIRPGYTFRAVDALITNFHLPQSTLLMLVCAFGGYTAVMRAYHSAIENQYRFFSYGDAMVVV